MKSGGTDVPPLFQNTAPYEREDSMRQTISLKRRQTLKTNLFLFSFVCIPVVLLLVFTYFPAAKLVYYSFTNYDGLSKNPDFVGLYNWKKLFSSPELWSTLLHSGYYIIGGIVQNALALLFAIILNDKLIKGRKAFRGIIFLPFILNGTSVSFMFRYFYNYSKGPLNLALKAIGLKAISWLGTEAIVNWSLAFVCLWRYTGYIMVIYLAALQSVPAEYYEAATIDGANSWQKLIHITLPQIRTIIGLQMFLNISGAINIFDIPFVITNGGPNGASQTLAIQAIEYAFTYKNYGLASAYSLFCTVMIIILYVAQNKVFFRKERG